jgi:chorismate mutase
MSLKSSKKLLSFLFAIVIFGIYVFINKPITGQSQETFPQTQLAISQDSTTAPPQQVDRLLNLIQQRLLIQNDVARNKWNQNNPIEALPREQKLLVHIREQAPTYNVDADTASIFFQWQIFAGKLIQIDNFQHWQTEGVEFFDHVPDLNQVLRPSLDQLTPEILTALASLAPVLNCSTVQQLIQSRAQIILLGEGIDTTVRRTAIAPLIGFKGNSCQDIPGLNGVKKSATQTHYEINPSNSTATLIPTPNDNH